MEYNRTVEGESIDQILGKWKVLDVEERYPISDRSTSASEIEINTDLRGVEFTLDDHGDVFWSMPPSVEVDGLFLTSSYRISEEDIKFIDIASGASYKFTIELGPGIMRLTAKLERRRNGVCINCQQIQEPKPPPPLTFQLLPALEEGFFSDLVIHSDDRFQFNVHRVILGNRMAGMKYQDWGMLLSGKPKEVVRAILYYIYTDSLPVNLKETVAREVLEQAKLHPKLQRLSELCSVYLEKYALKTTITEIILDLHQRIDSIKAIVSSLVLSDPAKLVYAIHQIIKEVGIICIRFVVLCETYLKRKDELSKGERKEILEYARGRVPMFLDQSREAIELILEKWQSIPLDQKYEIAQYLIPEVSRIWELLAVMVDHSKEAFTKVHSQVQKESKKFTKKVSEHLYMVSHLGEMRRMRKLQRELEGSSGVIELIRQKETKFDVLEDNVKVGRMLQACTSIERWLCQAVKHLQNAKRMILVENRLEWRQWKLYVSHVTSHLTWILAKLRAAGDPLKPVALDVCRHIGQKTFSDAVVSLGLLSESDLPRGGNDDNDIAVASEASAVPSSSSSNVLTMSMQLPSACESLLAQGISKLLCSHELSDMEFVIATPMSPVDTSPVESVVIPAHRVIVAARCEYFRMALQSGMKESIDRKIVIHDMDESMFKLFLKFVYSGHLDTSKLSMEEMIEVLAVADRYETVSLKEHCEQLLIGQIKDSTAFILLNIADRFTAKKLREATMSMVSDRPDLREKEHDAFVALPQELQTDIMRFHHASVLKKREKITSTAGRDLPPDTLPKVSKDPPMRRRSYSSSSSSSDSVNSSVASDSFNPTEPTEVMGTYIEQLRTVVGDEPTDEILSELLLAADMDVNRAINFYFNLS